jgi:hypothetical protein
MKRILCLIIVVSTVFVQAQEKNEIDSYILKQISEQKITGLALGVVKNGKLLVSKVMAWQILNLILLLQIRLCLSWPL